MSKAKKTSRIDEYEKRANAYLESVKTKNNKSFLEKVILFVNEVTSHIFFPYTSWVAVPVGVIGLIICVSLKSDVAWFFAGILLMCLFDIVYETYDKCFKNK